MTTTTHTHLNLFRMGCIDMEKAIHAGEQSRADVLEELDRRISKSAKPNHHVVAYRNAVARELGQPEIAEPAAPAAAQRSEGYLVGNTTPKGVADYVASRGLDPTECITEIAKLLKEVKTAA